MENSHSKEYEFTFPACPEKPEIPSPDERTALENMRSIRDRAKKIKGDLANLQGESDRANREEIETLEAELNVLKQDWLHWDLKRQEATKERNRLLGHEK